MSQAASMYCRYLVGILLVAGAVFGFPGSASAGFAYPRPRMYVISVFQALFKRSAEGLGRPPWASTHTPSGKPPTASQASPTSNPRSSQC